jgi:cobalt-zinc-cadmium efflux system protein
MLVAAAAAFFANVGSVLLLRTHSAEDINVRSAFLHLAQDALASLAVVVAALFARTAAGRYVDPAVAILIGVVVLRSAISIVSESLHTLLEVEAIAAEVRRFLHEEWGITHATLEAEANGCGREDLLGDWK